MEQRIRSWTDLHTHTRRHTPSTGRHTHTRARARARARTDTYTHSDTDLHGVGHSGKGPLAMQGVDASHGTGAGAESDECAALGLAGDAVAEHQELKHVPKLLENRPQLLVTPVARDLVCGSREICARREGV